ncbi:GTP 3',8-cyclase MoaA [Desulfobulbus rhabdoformis]|jgi:cyclic pyranopterin phosphate synthase|uniref:GTP 3',8-cyclase MoaA n=1 Tax=Desulfobulbus rhabdoformis TaxID=34032 RepID=UPI0019661F60|nr:GTP 3',8-cyclase MoaA [Desulfobulbus rhabdoformis]MBM9616454.1 GTP 3',8-cyclase MoaA [Desulfobulbus rhabdoformis]
MKAKNSSFPPPGKSLTDLFSRSISYLRLSLTDRCNLRCIYCVTEDESSGSLTKLKHEELLTYEELLHVVRVAVNMGITKVRLTGGEPLVRRGVLDFIRDMMRIEGLDDVRITTNGVLLAGCAQELLDAGVSKVNISLDSLKAKRVQEITGIDCFDKVWQGIEKVLALGFSPVKVNMVAMRHINDDEILDFARLSQQLPLQMRFIEFMPIGASSRWDKDTYISTDEIMERVSALGELIPMQKGRADGPAKVFRLGADAPGSLGFISPLSHHFCDRCNRLRLTSAGSLRSCLLHDEEVDLRSILRNQPTDEAIQAAMIEAIRNKPRGHQLTERMKQSGSDCHGRMSRIGG